MSYFDDSRDRIEDIIGNMLCNTLNDELTFEIAKDCTDEIIAELKGNDEVRFVLVDPDTGLLESRIIFDDPIEAEKYRQTVKDGRLMVAMLLV